MKKRRFAVQASKVTMALALICGGQAVLAKAVHVAPAVQAASAAANTVMVDGHEYSEDVVEALNYYNGIREKMGVQKVKLNPFMQIAAENHLAYLEANNFVFRGPVSAHREEAGKPGFTGVSFADRLATVGFSSRAAWKVYENVASNQASAFTSIDNLMNMPYHRTPMMDPAITEFAFAHKGETSVLTFIRPASGTGLSVYPYDGQKDVPVSFYGPSENPNPLTQFGLETSGYIASYADIGNIFTDVTASMKDSKGNSLEIFKLKDNHTWHIIPKNELAHGETYTVTVQGKTWSFTTVSDGTTQPATPTKPPATSENPPRKFNADDVGVRLEGRYIDLTPRAKVINGSTFIPLRGVFESMGATLKWTPAPSSVVDSTGRSKKPEYQGIVNIRKGDTEIEIYIGTTRAFINGIEAALSIAPFISDEGAAYVPLRFASEALGAEVSWESDTYTAVIGTAQ
ncbi:stalk domain-containing protein [Paenibacillus chartarius]|uniref:Stalk domain-containing protein n=1 Tax=Paenibacillus chartarius TaxID=747481 RepID=A0ABV6DSG9_9BACL